MVSPIIGVVCFLVLIATVYLGLSEQKKALDSVYNTRFKAYQTCAEITEGILGYHADLYKLISWSSSGYSAVKINSLVGSEKIEMDRISLEIEKAMGSAGIDDREKTLYSTAVGQLGEYAEWAKKVLEMAGSDLSIASMFMGTAEDKMTILRGTLASLKATEKLLGSETYSSAARSSDLTLRNVTAIFAAAVALSVFASLILSRRIMRSLDSLSRRAKDISKGTGDLTLEISSGTRDEIGELGSSFSEFIEKLEQTIARVKETSKKNKEIGETLSRIAVDTSSDIQQISATVNSSKDSIQRLNDEIQSSVGIIEKIAGHIEEMAKSIESQSAAVTESSASIEEIAASIGTITSVVEQKKELSDRLSQTAQDGFKKMEMSSDAIVKVSRSADSVVKMVDVINGITANLNLLAMNAAIEAAHAGEWGRGFAVVAQEVRSLAEDTARNAKSIAKTLKATVSDMQSASQLNLTAKSSMADLISGIKDIVNAMEETRSGMGELSTGSKEIVKAVSSLMELMTDIRERSTGINENSASINANMSRVAGLSAQTSGGMQEITVAVSHVSEAMTRLSEIGKANEQSSAEIDRELAQFKTREAKE